MRKERLVRGLNNSQKIRVIVAGVGFYTTVGETQNICTTKHRTATHMALMNLVHKRGTNPEVTGFGFNYVNAENEAVDIQVDLV
jgi:hypothetical protein